MARLLLVAVVGMFCVGAVATASAATTVRVNVDPSGAQTRGTGPFVHVVATAGGRLVVFESGESDLVAGDTNGFKDVFVRDMVTGTTERVDISPRGAQLFFGADLEGVSPGGRYIAFVGCSFRGCHTDLRDRMRQVTYRFPLRRPAAPAAVSAAGRYVAFTTYHGRAKIWDRRRETVRPVGIPPSGVRFERPEVSGISAGGRYVLFSALQVNRNAGPRRHISVWVRDRFSGRTLAVDVSSAEHGPNGFGFPDAISADGRYVMFHSFASNLVARDANGAEDVFVRDLVRGTTRRISIGSHAQQGDNTSVGVGLSAHGRYRAFLSNAGNLVPGDTNHHRDLFLRDPVTGLTRRVNLSTAGVAANGATWTASLSPDGRWVAFVSAADNLVPGDTNKKSDVFLCGPLS